MTSWYTFESLKSKSAKDLCSATTRQKSDQMSNFCMMAVIYSAAIGKMITDLVCSVLESQFGLLEAENFQPPESWFVYLPTTENCAYWSFCWESLAMFHSFQKLSMQSVSRLNNYFTQISQTQTLPTWVFCLALGFGVLQCLSCRTHPHHLTVANWN